MKRTVTIDGPPSRSVRARSNNRVSKASYSRIPRGIQNGKMNTVHRFKRLCIGRVNTNQLGFIVGVTASPRFAMQFNQSQAFFYISALANVTMNIPNYAEFAAIFDQIMIESVTVKFTHTVNGADTFNGIGLNVLYTALDYNDANVPASDQDILQYSTVQSKVLQANTGPIVRRIKPRFAQAVYTGPLGISFGARRGFLQKDIDVPHYGLKGFVQLAQFTDSIGGYMNIEVTYNYACKNVV